jgi:hypothetical protein
MLPTYCQMLLIMIVSMLLAKGRGKYMHMNWIMKRKTHMMLHMKWTFLTVTHQLRPYKPLHPNLHLDNVQNDKVCMPKDKSFGLDQKTKDLWDQIDDKYKSAILGYAKSSSPSPFRTPSKPPFHPKQHRGINLHEMSAYEYLQVNSHELEPDPAPDEIANEESQVDEINPESPYKLLVNAAKGSRPSPLRPGDIRRVLSKNSKRSVSMTQIENKVSYHKASPGQSLTLIDRGANGGVAGTDAVDIRGIDNHKCTNIDIGTVGGDIQTQKGPIISIMHQYA